MRTRPEGEETDGGDGEQTPAQIEPIACLAGVATGRTGGALWATPFVRAASRTAIPAGGMDKGTIAHIFRGYNDR
jgi:hypothetical protein